MRAVCAFVVAVVGALSVARAGTETARPADAFINSIGINTHYNNAPFTDTPYGKPELSLKLNELGIRHIRDNTQTGAGFTAITALYRTFGIRTDLVLTAADVTPQQIVDVVAQVPAIESVEGINEPDGYPISYLGLSDDPSTNDFSATRAFHNDLYLAMKANTLTRSIPVLSPALMDAGKTPALTGISLDVASMHSYPLPHKPTFQLDGRIWQVSHISETPVPIIATETGYFTRVTGDIGVVSETAMAKYIPRLFAEYFNRGINRTYTYALVDGVDDPADPFANFGLLRNDLSPKPAYTALKNLISLLKDPAGASAPTTGESLNYTLTGGGATLQHTLLQKSDGTFDLLLWNDLESFDANAKLDIVNAPVPVTLNVAGKFDLAQVFIPGVSSSAVAAYADASRINLMVSDEMMVVQLSRSIITHVPEPGALICVGSALAFLLIRKPR